MSHSGAQTLIDLWASLPRKGRFPLQSAFAPERLGALLPHAFIVQADDAGLSLRLAGSWIERLHGRTLKGVWWLDLWDAPSRVVVHRSASQALLEARPILIQAIAGPGPARFEIALAPMKGPDGAPNRLLGLCRPIGPEAEALRDVPVLTAHLAVPVEVLHRGPAPVLAAVDGRRIA